MGLQIGRQKVASEENPKVLDLELFVVILIGLASVNFFVMDTSFRGRVVF